MKCLLRAIVIGAVLATTLGAQDASDKSCRGAAPGRYVFFGERSSIGVPVIKHTLHAPAYYDQWKGNDFDDVWFEASIAPMLYFHDGVCTNDVLHGTNGGWSKVWSFVPFVRLRQLGGFSSPLRSPSFSPRFLSLQLLNIARSDPYHVSGDIRIWELQALLQHHSNGGPGCLFLEDHRNDKDQCVSSIPAWQRTVDTAGSFSTDYAELGAGLIKGKVADTGKRKNSDMRTSTASDSGSLELVHALTAAASVELHSRWFVFLPGYISREQQSIYGPYRLKGRVEWQQSVFHSHWKWVAGANAQYILYEHKPSPDASPEAYGIETSLTPDYPGRFFNGWGARLRYYQGQDYYNLFFFRDVRRLYVEFVIDPMSQQLIK